MARLIKACDNERQEGRSSLAGKNGGWRGLNGAPQRHNAILSASLSTFFPPSLLSLSLFLSEIFITRRVKIKSDLLFETTHRQTTIHRIEIIPKKKIYICVIFITRRVKIKSDLLFETTHHQTTIHRIEIISKKKTVPFEVFYLFFFLNFLHFSFDSFSFHIQTFIAIQNEQLNNSLEKNPSTSSQREREKGRKEALSSE